MIVTLTLNPSLDRTFTVQRMQRGEVNRVTDVWTEPAGKGVNVAKALRLNGTDAAAVLPVGGPDGQELVRALKSEGLGVHAIPISGAVRSNVTVVESDGTVTKLNEPGPELTAQELDALIDKTVELATDAAWVAASGNLPPGVPHDIYASLALRLRAAGRRVAVDTSGIALERAIDACPDLVKPNLDELEALVGRPLRTLGEVVDEATVLVERGVGHVVVSLGADGAVVVDQTGATFGSCRVDSVGNTVGAGDTLLAGFLAAGSEDRDVALTRALAWARAAVTTPTTAMDPVTSPDFEAVSIASEIDRGMTLAESVRSHRPVESVHREQAGR